MAIRSYAATDIGLRRTLNEDSYLACDALRLYMVADGMGGHVGGEIASRTAIQAIQDFIKQVEADPSVTWPFSFVEGFSRIENVILTAVRLANQTLCRMVIERPELAGMGTTIAGVRIYDQHAAIFNVGDSRVYCARKDTLIQLTTDHSWVTEQLQRHVISEEEARRHRWKNVITRALGSKTAVDVDVRTVDLDDGDTFVICTDGLSGCVSDWAILESLRMYSDDLEQMCQQLITQAKAAGGHDNITVVVLQYTADTPDVNSTQPDAD
ncbi:Stp1/IreP family PP2C-type Ser/Thr phosphatase [Candidatus Sumerlaeota bacterium]|nr:Stp1/IreP family PP2C-type Ser/Thr phosphatase [Candidatus Sumerlaeota bacterium]